MAKNAQNSEITADVVAIYNEHVLVISELKKSQWQNGYTMLALFGALIALRKDIQYALGDCLLYIAALGVPLILGSAGIYVAYKLHRGLTRRRQLIWRGREFLSEKARNVYNERRSEEEKEPTCWTDFHVPLLTVLTIISAAVLCGVLLWVRMPDLTSP